MVGIEHDPPAVGFEFEHVGHDARQQDRAHSTVDESEIGDRRMHTDVVGFGGVARCDGILGRPVQLDVADGLAAEARDERP